MGWLWSTAAPKAPDASSPSTAATEAAAAAAAASPAATTATAPPPNAATSSTTTANDYDDPELRTFVAMFQASTAPTAATTPTAPASSTPSSSSSTATATATTATTTATTTPADPPLRERSLGDALLPTSMSCRQAFDLAWACQSPAGQWRAVYRHGSVQPCSRLWDDFWFCMRVRGGGPGGSSDDADPQDSRARAVREHYRAREIERYYGPGQPSSEDVWRSRTIDEVLPPGAVFQHAFQVAGDARGDSTQPSSEENSSSSADAASRKDADQILADMERRRQIRQQIGYNS